VEGEIQFVGYTDGNDKLQAMLTLKKRKNVEIVLDQITGLILAFFIGNTSSLMDLGPEYKWCPAGNIMGSTWCAHMHYKSCVVVAGKPHVRSTRGTKLE